MCQHISTFDIIKVRSRQISVLLFVLMIAWEVGAADTQPPWVTITQPTNGSTLSNVVTVAANTTDNVAVASVSFKVDGATVGSPLTSPPFSFTLATANVPNGIHTLLAVATDAAGNAGRSAWVQITVTNQSRYTLGSGPFVVENLGTLIASATQERQVFFVNTNGDSHLLLYYWGNYGTQPGNILDINLSQSTVMVTNSVLGRPGPKGTAYTNGNIYLTTYDTPILVGELMQYNPITGATNFIANLTQNGQSTLEFGQDGWLYIGNSGGTRATVDRYNFTSGAFERLGEMDSNHTFTLQYAYSLGADDRYLYVGLGQSPWYLGVYDTVTSNKTVYWYDDADTSGYIFKGKAGGWYYQRQGSVTGGVKWWYALSNGVATLVTNTSWDWYTNVYYYNQLAASEGWRGGVVDNASIYTNDTGYEFDLSGAYPDSSNNVATVLWRQTNTVNWSSASGSNFQLAAATLKRVYPCSWDSGKLLVLSFAYGPLLKYDTALHTTQVLGHAPYSLYDGVAEGNKWYLSGYPAVTLEYDPAVAWTLTASTIDKTSPSVNAHKISLAIGKYHYYSTLGADGLVYVGSHHERDSVGGELGWYDPVTGTNGSLRTPFLYDDVHDLKAAVGGTKMVYSGAHTNLYVFDVATKSIERIIVPLPNVSALDKVCEVSSGIVFGAAESNIFKVNILTGAILYTNTIPGQAFGETAVSGYDRRLTMGPDGYAWMFIGNAIYRINPTDGSMTNLVSAAPRNLMFNGGDLYLYGGPNLYRVKGVLVTRPDPAEHLHVLPSGQ